MSLITIKEDTLSVTMTVGQGVPAVSTVAAQEAAALSIAASQVAVSAKDIAVLAEANIEAFNSTAATSATASAISATQSASSALSSSGSASASAASAVESATSALSSSTSATQAASSAASALSSKLLAEVANSESQANARLSGVQVYRTFAEAFAARFLFKDLQLIRVAKDETRGGAETYYSVSLPASGTLSLDFTAGRYEQLTVGFFKNVGLNFVAAPATSTSAGFVGDVAVDSNFAYFAVGLNQWKRTALTTF